MFLIVAPCLLQGDQESGGDDGDPRGVRGGRGQGPPRVPGGLGLTTCQLHEGEWGWQEELPGIRFLPPEFDGKEGGFRGHPPPKRIFNFHTHTHLHNEKQK